MTATPTTTTPAEVAVAPFGWAYVGSVLLGMVLVLALMWLVAKGLDRLAGLYDDTSTSASGRSRPASSAPLPDMTRPPWWSQDPLLLRAQGGELP